MAGLIQSLFTVSASTKTPASNAANAQTPAPSVLRFTKHRTALIASAAATVVTLAHTMQFKPPLKEGKKMTGEFVVAVHAIEVLFRSGKSLSSEALAANVCTNPARIRKVMAKLKKAGLVETKVGADGGYCFTQNPGEVTLRQVLEAVGDKVVAAGWKSGNPDMECLVCAGMAHTMDTIFSELNSKCLDHLNTITIEKLDMQYLQRRQNQ